MQLARAGKGVDRHLLGLYCVAVENDFPIPDFLTQDPLVVRSGGNGNFVLSTSTTGYFLSLGFVAPMVEHGYGVFYNILGDNCWFVVTTYKTCEETSGEKFVIAFNETMTEIKEAYGKFSSSML